MAKTIEGLFYSESHEWVKVDGETAIIGISDHAQQAMGNIVYVDMPEEEDEVTANEDFGAVESVKAASDLISPVSGVVVEVNEALADAPELLNKDAYENWIIKVKMDDPEELKKLSSKIDHLGHTLNQYKRRIKASLSPQYSLRSILGESAPMRRLKQQVQSYAQLDAPVLILGATGAGKELFAHALHAESPRAEGPLVSINCAAIPKDLFESELFGYARGAFSGAHQDGKIGQIELADKGTLFLDEIGEMPPEIQAKLLRVLESRSICRVGSVNARNVDFRLVAATNRNISAMLSAGSFREDLYYRINTFVLEIPPLRDRADDILPIARYVLSRMGLEHLTFSPEAEAAMLAFSWPGNVRQLHNAVVHAATMRHGDLIEVDDFPPDTLPSADLPLRTVAAGDLSDIMADTEAVVIRKVLAEQGGNVSRTARTLHIARATLYEKLRKYGISRR